MIAPLVRWDHKDDWPVPNYSATQGTGLIVSSAERVYTIGLNKPDYEYLSGHTVESMRFLY